MWISKAPVPRITRKSEAELKAEQFFKERGIHPTLAEYREVCACMRNGSNPFGIH